MRFVPGSLLLVFISVSPCAFAQSWEAGVVGGFGFYRDAEISSGSTTAKAGFGPRFGVGAYLGHSFLPWIDGEFHYLLRDGDLELKQQGRQANMDGDAQLFHFDVVAHPSRKNGRLQPYAAIGAGLNVYRATGIVDSNQPLRELAVLTNGSQTKGVVDFGAGVKYSMLGHFSLRIDLHDYVTGFPQKLFPLTAPSRESGALHDFVPTLGVGICF